MMETGTLIVILAVVAGGGFLLYRIWEYASWDKGKSYEDFKKRFPKHFKNDQFLGCPVCAGRVLRIMKYRGGKMKKYLCKECGRELWRSKE